MMAQSLNVHVPVFQLLILQSVVIGSFRSTPMNPRIEFKVQTRPLIREMQQPPTVGHRMAFAAHKAASRHAKKPDV
jgi:hypothetical protein